MPKKQRNLLSDCCYHISHRCQRGRDLLRFAGDRDNYLIRLRQMQKKHRISVLNYIITSDHIHLLLWAKEASRISIGMRFLQGVVTKDYNRRKGYEGSCWLGRYKATLVQNGLHLSRCSFYIDFNMIRAGNVKHPGKWKWSGYQELSGQRKRYRIIDDSRTQACLGISNEQENFSIRYSQMIDDLSSNFHTRVGIWSESVAVGDLSWISNLSQSVLYGKSKIIQIPMSNSYVLDDQKPSYALQSSARNRAHFTRNFFSL